MMGEEFQTGTDPTGIAIVGCGYVAELYLATLENWSNIRLIGVFDIDSARLKRFARFYGVRKFDSLEALLADPGAEIVLNLTNPTAHYQVTRTALEFGKHVYSEKPLAMDLAEARELTQLSRRLGLMLSSAPCSVLGASGQTMARALRERQLGTPRLVYAELDDGMVHRIGFERWKVRSGTPWPATDEFRTGCTLEHAGYVLTWLCSFFGPVRRLVSVSACLIRDKGPLTPENYDTPDFSVAALEFDGGLIARVTNSIIAPHDHRFRVFCDDGELSVAEPWDYTSPVVATPVGDTVIRRQLEKKLGWRGSTRLKLEDARHIASASRGYPMDFSTGPAAMAEALRTGTEPHLNAEFSLHITELALAIQHPERFGTPYIPQHPFPASSG